MEKVNGLSPRNVGQEIVQEAATAPLQSIVGVFVYCQCPNFIYVTAGALQ